ncbi:unnamed protein product [Hermetia illucens]|uniref:Carboxylesterase type B domain-containing protein n=2 Tax=Hermetia illucens TaxID=343691 RepID=A0A7R8UB22_HERIL|nr:unnamed protein product [Hermetia illucens]
MEGFAVIVWFHSGDFSYGSAADLDPFQMVFKQKVIVITVAYRLNIFGFLTSMDGESSGNFGLMDQAAALLWIKRNIKLFNGNDNSITLMGHGSGAISVGLHLLSGDWSEGLFHKAIMMSGSPLFETTVKRASWYATSLNTIANSFGCFKRPTSKLLECLRHINAQILSENLPFIEWGPIIDDGLSNTTMPFVPDTPLQLIERGQLRKVPLLIGYTNMEEVLDVILGDMMETGISTEMYDTLITDIVLADLPQLESNESCGSNIPMVTDAIAYTYKPYPPVTDNMMLRKKFVEFATERKYAAPTLQLADFVSKSSTCYVYRFDTNPRSAIAKEGFEDWVVVPHNYDLIFVWGIPYWPILDMAGQWESTDKRISEIIMTLWANFVKFGIPTKFGVSISWDEFTTEKQNLLLIDRSFNMSDEKSLHFQGIKFWNDYFPRVVDHAMHCCNMTDGSRPVFHVDNSMLTYVLLLTVTVIMYSQAS